MHIHRAPITDCKLRFALVSRGRVSRNCIEALRRHADVADDDRVVAALARALE